MTEKTEKKRKQKTEGTGKSIQITFWNRIQVTADNGIYSKEKKRKGTRHR